MFNLRKIILIFLLVAFLVLLSASFSLAAEEEKGKPLEIEYPEIGEWQPKTVEQAVLPEYIKYIFTFSIAIAGLVAFGALIYGGFRYITSAGAPAAQTEAKDQIFAGVIGLAILLSSYLILTTINPQLVLLKSPEILVVKGTKVPGVYLSTKEEFPSDEEIKNGEKVYRLTSSVDNLRDLGIKDPIRSIKIINFYTFEENGKEKIELLDFGYGVILYPEEAKGGRAREGNCSFARTAHLDPTKPTPFNKLQRTPLSITVFQEIRQKPEGGTVYVYSEPEYGYGGGKGKLEPTSINKEGKIEETVDLESLDKMKGKVWSVKMTGGNFLLVLHGENVWKTPMCVDFDSSQPNLTGLAMNKCIVDHSGDQSFWRYKSCATSYALFPLY